MGFLPREALVGPDHIDDDGDDDDDDDDDDDGANDQLTLCFIRSTSSVVNASDFDNTGITFTWFDWIIFIIILIIIISIIIIIIIIISMMTLSWRLLMASMSICRRPCPVGGRKYKPACT